MGLGHHGQPLRALRLRDGGHRRRALGAHVAAAAIAEAVIHAAGSPFVAARGDGRRAGERMPPERSGGAGHHLGEAGAAQRRHRVGACPRPLEDVAARVDLAVDVAGLSGHADLDFDLVVVRLELLEPERPVFDGGALGQLRGAVPAARLAHHLEVPRVQPPALGPVVKRGAADGVHHRVNRRPRRVRRRRVGPVRRNLAIGLLHRLRPAAEVVAQLVGREVRRRQPRARFESDDVEPGLCERQRRHAAGGAEPHDDDVGAAKLSGHAPACGSRTSSSRRPTCAWAPFSRRGSAAPR